MSEATAEEYFPNDTYRPQWFLFWVLAIAGGILLWINFFRPAPVTAPPRAAISAGYDWFLVLHMPEIPQQDTAKAAALQQKYSGWLEALAKEGYHPMLLSDIEQRMARGQGLPERAVVLMFEPAYYHTYEALAPISQYRFPALWVSDHTAFLRSDRHFINRHQTQWMVRSGFWDLGYTGDGFWRKTSDSNTMTIDGATSGTWDPGAGRTALNWGTDLPHLKRLDVSSKWTSEDLLTRLEMELPLEGTVKLGAKRIQDHLWGVVMTSAQKSNIFSLQASLGATAANLYWLGTRGVADVQLDIEIPSFFGQASLWLRSDYKAGHGIGIGFTHQEIFVDQKVQGARRRLASMRWTPPSGAIKGRVIITGTQLRLAIDGTDPLTVNLAPDTLTSSDMVRLAVFDRVRGAARAEFVNLTLTALSKPPH